MAMDTSVKTVSFQALWTAWPRVGSRDLADKLGGNLSDLIGQRSDDSAIRLSSAFAHAGHPLPKSTLWSGVDVTDRDGFK